MKRTTAIALVLFALASSALAQQPQITPSQMAIQIDNGVNGLASAVEVLQAQLKQAQAHIKELEDKYEPKKPEVQQPTSQ